MQYQNYLVGFLISLVLLLSSACKANEAITLPPCPMENLMISRSLFSEEWYGSGVPHEQSAPVRWGVEKLGVGFNSKKNGVALQDVHRGRNIEDAEAGYFELVDSWFDSEEDATDWNIPPEFNYQSTIADRYRFGCRTYEPSGVESCQLVGQYGVYLTRFHTFMSPIMTYQDLDQVLQTIDQKMMQCLNN